MNARNQFVAQICHISAAAPGGERYDPSLTDEQRRAYDNLIILCYAHHVETNDVSRFSVRDLTEMKRTHERKYGAVVTLVITSRLVSQAIDSIAEPSLASSQRSRTHQAMLVAGTVVVSSLLLSPTNNGPSPTTAGQQRHTVTDEARPLPLAQPAPDPIYNWPTDSFGRHHFGNPDNAACRVEFELPSGRLGHIYGNYWGYHLLLHETNRIEASKIRASKGALVKLAVDEGIVDGGQPTGDFRAGSVTGGQGEIDLRAQLSNPLAAAIIQEVVCTPEKLRTLPTSECRWDEDDVGESCFIEITSQDGDCVRIQETFDPREYRFPVFNVRDIVMGGGGHVELYWVNFFYDYKQLVSGQAPFPQFEDPRRTRDPWTAFNGAVLSNADGGVVRVGFGSLDELKQSVDAPSFAVPRLACD